MEGFRYIQKTKLNNLPKAPGVYALSSSKGVLYIGKAGNIKERVKNHLKQPTSRDAMFINDVQKVGYIKADSEIDALLLESQLIKKQQPKYNVMWKDDKKYFYVAVTKEKLPRIFLTHQPTMKSPSATPGEPSDAVLAHMARKVGFPPKAKQFAFGPFVEGRAIKKVLRLLRKVFPYYTTKKHGPVPCSWCNLNLCPGPNPDPAHYRKNLKKLVSVLQGKRTMVLRNLDKEMRAAARAQDYEKASLLRDQILALERIISHAKLFVPALGSLAQWEETEKTLQRIFQTKKRFKRVEAYDISNIQGKEATGSQVTFLAGVPAKEWYRKYKIRLEEKPNDFAMMEELVSRRLTHLEWPYPQLMVIDGGKGQLSSALQAISSLPRASFGKLALGKAQSIRVVALAKKQSELFFPGKPKSVLLRDLPRPLENLFLHIRDEAHRFAVSYHRKLREKALGLTSRKKGGILQ